MCDGSICPCNLLEPGDPDYNPRAVGFWTRRRHRRQCFHGRPATVTDPGVSYVESVGHLDHGRKMWECIVTSGGCGHRWIL